MLAKKFRLTKQNDFNKILKTGRFISGRFIFLKTLKNNFDFSRFTIVVSVKISKKAVVRNKIKRRMRAIAQNNYEKIRPGYDIMIMTKPGIDALEYCEIEKELIDLLHKV